MVIADYKRELVDPILDRTFNKVIQKTEKTLFAVQIKQGNSIDEISGQ